MCLIAICLATHREQHPHEAKQTKNMFEEFISHIIFHIKQIAKIQFFGISSATPDCFYGYNAFSQLFIVRYTKNKKKEKKMYLCRRKKALCQRLKMRDFGTGNTSR